MTDLEHPDALAIDSNAAEADEVAIEVCTCGRARGSKVHHYGATNGHPFEARSEDPPRKKRRKGTSPMPRTLADRVLTLEVHGLPAPKGSSRAILIGGRPVLVPSTSNANRDALRAWDRAIKAAAEAARFVPFGDTPLRVAIEFRFARPASHYGTGRNAGTLKATAPRQPAVKPDVDKLARATLDSLTGLAFDDDSRIVELVASKRYADYVPGDPLRPGWSGATITVEAFTVESWSTAP